MMASGNATSVAVLAVPQGRGTLHHASVGAGAPAGPQILCPVHDDTGRAVPLGQETLPGLPAGTVWRTRDLDA
jgi:hypothetical protein